MYISKLTIENFRCFGAEDDKFELQLGKGLTALVGENDCGKTAVIDAIRFALGTTDQDWNRIEDTDFHTDSNGKTATHIKIVCEFDDLNDVDKRAFLEYLIYNKDDSNDVRLIVNWTAEDTGKRIRNRAFRRYEIRSGKDGDGPQIAQEARDLLRATYLRPLRDAEQALSSGRGSRLSQVLHHTNEVTEGRDFDEKEEISKAYLEELSVPGIGDLANALLVRQKGVKGAREKIDEHLAELDLTGDAGRITSAIKVSDATASDDVRLRQLLEKLDLSLGGAGKLGLGSNNLLFMACEFLLLSQEDEGSKILLIEEPEAHLHAQRQLRTMKYLQDQAAQQHIQIIVTTHSPNLASAIDLNNIVMIDKGRAYSMAESKTELASTDYRFLQRFLDVTKANLFFARGVLIVEGDSENILLPTLAKLIGRDLTEHGVSIVNVGGTGLRRYARIFKRKDERKYLQIPVACVTDMDVMPDCAPSILGLIGRNDSWPPINNKRHWRARKDIGDLEALKKHRNQKVEKASGQCVRTFVSDEWTLEYDLAYSGLAEDVYVAAYLAQKEAALDKSGKELNKEELNKETTEAEKEFTELKKSIKNGDADSPEFKETLGSEVYAMFTSKKGKASKTIAAQYLAERLKDRFENGSDELRNKLPKYLVDAIEYVTQALSEESIEAEQVQDDE